MEQRSSPPRTAEVWSTPLYKQYWGLKDKAPGCLLFFRLGDFYELFGDDALEAAPILEVQLTSRDKSSASPIPMCGVPAHAVDSYAERLLARGKRVALAEQLTQPGEKKIVERDIIRILTPGLPIDYSRLESRAPHWFLSVADKKSSAKTKTGALSWQVLAYDFLGAELFEGPVEGLPALVDLLERLDPQEILVPAAWLGRASLKAAPPLLDESSRWHARVTPWAGEEARANLEAYLTYTQRCDAEQLGRLLPEARDLDRLVGGQGDWARVPANVYEHWAVFPELQDLLDGTGSAVGSRKLRSLLSSPLRNPKRLRSRQAAFARLENADALLKDAREVYDFERILGRFRVGAAAPRELLRFIHSLSAVCRAVEFAPLRDEAWKTFVREEGLPDLGDLRGELEPLRRQLETALKVDVDATRMTELVELVREGYDIEFDRLRSLQTNAQDWLTAFEERLRDETSIPSLKVRFNRVFGHYIEVTKANLDKVPSHFERKQTTVGGERFTCAELRAKETEILTAGARAEAKAREILERLQAEILGHDAELRRLNEHFAWADAVAGMWASVTKLRRFGPWATPEVLDGEFFFSLKEARHPIIEARTGSFVANSLELGGAAPAHRLLVLTGPNMAGKSTLMRQTGLCLLLAQCGLPVPAAALRFAPCSGFYSRMGATDRILEGESTFMVEMKETAEILRKADAQSFLLLDEIGRGTSTQDGLAIAHAVLDHLHNELGAVGIFATHYHELSDVVPELPRSVNGSMSLKEWEGDLVFLRTLEMAPAESSYGIYVAKLAGLPPKLLKRAQALFDASVEAAHVAAVPQLSLFGGMEASAEKPATAEAEKPAASGGLFVANVPAPSAAPPAAVEAVTPVFDELRDELSRLQVDEMSPKQAWLTLESLVGKYARSEA